MCLSYYFLLVVTDVRNIAVARHDVQNSKFQLRDELRTHSHVLSLVVEDGGSLLSSRGLAWLCRG